MTRKDFELIARTIKKLDLHSVSYQEAQAHVSRLFANALQEHSGNANFDRAKFVKACGAAT